MNIKNRLKKLQKTIRVDDDLCRCPDALALIGTPFDKLCHKCAKEIDISTWKHWQNIHPYNRETNWFAFGLRRDDKDELKDFHSSYFSREMSDILFVWKCLSVSEAEDEDIKYELFLELPAMLKDEFYEHQNRHIIGNHLSYEEYLVQSKLLCLYPKPENQK